MKKIFAVSLAVMIFTTTVFGQFRKVPANVTNAFKEKFPAAQNVSWADRITSFQASYDEAGTHYQSSFSSKGEWKKTEKELDLSSLPAVVSSKLQDSKYTDWKLKSASEITDNDDNFEYHLLIEKSALQKKYIYLNREGQLLREAVTL